MRKIIPALIFCITLFFCSHASPEDGKAVINIIKGDRVLILAPHPDDEAIGACGIIQHALKKNAKIRVVCYTNGDSNELAFIVYEKRITFKRGEFLHMGEVRRRETVRAMVSLGLKPDDIVFLGYPDFGTLEMFTKYWGDTAPFTGLFTKVSKVSYPDAMSFGAPYSGESVLNDLKKTITDFKPTKIFVSHPADINRDHKALYLFLQVALWDLEKKIRPPGIFPYIIHVVRWPIPRGYHSELDLKIPDSLTDSGIAWKSLALTEDETKNKRYTIAYYKSQNECNPWYLSTFARRNELFGDFPAVRLYPSDNSKDIVWKELKNQAPANGIDPEHKKDQERGVTSDIAYGLMDNKLFVRFQLKERLEKKLGVSVFLIGYSPDADFSKMPKLYIKLDTLGLHVKDKKQALQVSDIEAEDKGNILILKVPLYLLGSPDRILTVAKTSPDNLPLDESSWRTLYLKKEK